MAKNVSPLLGYNNNVRHKGRVFHVQTEDSGVKHPHVITHLFMDGGRILKSVKRSYAEHLAADKLADLVKQMMKEQHRAMFVALKNGELDALFDAAPAPPAKETAKPGDSRAEAPPAPPDGERLSPDSMVMVAAPPVADTKVPDEDADPDPDARDGVLSVAPAANGLERVLFTREMLTDPAPPPVLEDVDEFDSMPSEELLAAPLHLGGVPKVAPLISPSEPVRSSELDALAWAATQSGDPEPNAKVPRRAPSVSPTSEGRFAMPPPSSVQAEGRRASSTGSIFGTDAREKSLDEVILGYLAEYLDDAPAPLRAAASGRPERGKADKGGTGS